MTWAKGNCLIDWATQGPQMTPLIILYYIRIFSQQIKEWSNNKGPIFWRMEKIICRWYYLHQKIWIYWVQMLTQMRELGRLGSRKGLFLMLATDSWKIFLEDPMNRGYIRATRNISYILINVGEQNKNNADFSYWTQGKGFSKRIHLIRAVFGLQTGSNRRNKWGTSFLDSDSPNADISHLILDPPCLHEQGNTVSPLEGSTSRWTSNYGEVFSTSSVFLTWGRLHSRGHYLCMVALPFHLIKWVFVSHLGKMCHQAVGSKSKDHPPKPISAHFALSPSFFRGPKKVRIYRKVAEVWHHKQAKRVHGLFFTLEQIFLVL